MPNLFPSFEIPVIAAHQEDTSDGVFYPGPLFDFDLGDFTRNGSHQIVMVDGYDTYVLWCVKCTQTQKGACLAYPEFGIDIDSALAQPSREAVQSELERTLTEGLKRNKKTERVYDFGFVWDVDSVTVTFTVQPKNLQAFDLYMKIVT